MCCEEIRIKQGLFLHIILSIKDSLQQQIHFNGNIFGNTCCRCNEGSLYFHAYGKYDTVYGYSEYHTQAESLEVALWIDRGRLGVVAVMVPKP